MVGYGYYCGVCCVEVGMPEFGGGTLCGVGWSGIPIEYGG